jgi:NAD(P)-dependent dehydrogenase (short-subunit alcohol dehydrogenase family)
MKQSKFSLSSKNVVITGAVGILGKSFCRALAEADANLALIDINQDSVNELSQQIANNYKVKCKGYACDISVESSVIDTVNKIVADFGQVHVLHNNAATKSKNLDDFFKPFEDFSFEAWREIMAVNVDGMFLMAKHIGKHMVDNKIKGSIIQTASIYGVVAPDQRIYEGSSYLGRQISSPAVYSASKAAVIGLSNYLSAYWGHLGIRVNTLTPGGIESGQNDVFKNKYSARVPLNRMGHAEELTGALIYLASDASSYVTGQNIIVDGGLSVW